MRATAIQRMSGRAWVWLLGAAVVASVAFGLSPLSVHGQGLGDVAGISVTAGEDSIICEGLTEQECTQKKEEAAQGQDSLIGVEQTGQNGETRIFTGEQIGFFGIDPRTATAGEYVNLIYKFAISVIGFFAVAAVVFAGFAYVLSGGNEEQIRKAKDIITGAVTAVVIALLSHLILQTIDPRLVQLTSDFGADQNFDIAGFQGGGVYATGKVCTSDADCESIKPRFIYEICGGTAAGIDSGKQVTQDTICGKKPGEDKGYCAIPQGGVERVLSDFAGNCNDNTYLYEGVTCAPGLVPRPLADNEVAMEGNIISDDIHTIESDWDEFISAYINAGLPISTFGIAGDVDLDKIAYHEGPITYGQLRSSGTVDGMLIENVVRDNQGVHFAEDAAENHTNPQGKHYLYHACLPPTSAQKKYGSLITATNAGRASGTTCETDADCGDIERRINYCVEGSDDTGKIVDRVVTSKQTCEAGVCKIKEGYNCGSEGLEVCGERSISGRGVSDVVSGLLANNCEAGTVCLQINDDNRVGAEIYPRNYICAAPGVGNESGKKVSPFAYNQVDREGTPGQRADRLLGASCDVTADCADFGQDVFHCDGPNNAFSDYEETQRINTVCDTGAGKAHVDEDGVQWDGVCAIKQGDLCKMTGLNCGERSFATRSYENSCVSGTVCTQSQAPTQRDPALFTCQ